MYAENTIQSSPFKAPSLYNIPGSSLWLDIPENFFFFHGAIVMNNNLYVVFGVDVYKIDFNKNITLVGTMNTTAAKVIMVENGQQITILTQQGLGYYYTESTDTFGQITDPNFPNPAYGMAMLDGYTIVSEAETGQFFVSELRDTTTWSASATSTAEALSDNIIALATYKKQLYIFGQKSVEIFYNSGITAQPFRPVTTTFIPEGIIGRYAYVVSNSGVFWVTDTKEVYFTRDYNPRKISTFAIDFQLSKLAKPREITTFWYIQEGHEFVGFTSKFDNVTLVYDVEVGEWHERGSLSDVGNAQIYWKAQEVVNFNNQLIAGGFQEGELFSLEPNIYTEDGRVITGEIVSATVFNDFDRFAIREVILVMENGVGLPEPQQGSNPLVEMDVSTDGGKTWTVKREVSFGKEGEYLTQVTWKNVGHGRSFIFRFRITDPVPRVIVGAYYQLPEKGAR